MNVQHARRIVAQGHQINADMMARCESPIEELFLAAWLLDYPADVIQAQAHAQPYRLDFLVFGPRSRCAVEVDGWDFHRRTVEQVRADMRRDRWLNIHERTPTLRFLGTDIAADPNMWQWAHRSESDTPDGDHRRTPTVAEMVGMFEGGPDSVEWLRGQRDRGNHE